jgi:hypothetical protein
VFGFAGGRTTFFAVVGIVAVLATPSSAAENTISIYCPSLYAPMVRSLTAIEAQLQVGVSFNEY